MQLTGGTDSEGVDDTTYRRGLEYFSEVYDEDPLDVEQNAEEPAGGVPQGVVMGPGCFQSVFQDQQSIANQQAAKHVQLSGAVARKETEINIGCQMESVDIEGKSSNLTSRLEFSTEGGHSPLGANLCHWMMLWDKNMHGHPA